MAGLLKGIGSAIGSILGFGGDSGGGGNDNSAQYNHQQEMQSQRLAHEKDMERQKRAHEETMLKEQAAANERAKKLANEALKIEQKAETDRLKEKTQHEQKMKKLQQEENDKQRIFKAAADKRQKEHEKELEEIEKQKLKIQQETEAQEQKHKEDLRQMWIDAKEKDRANKEKQRDDALRNVERAIKNYEDNNKKATEREEEVKELHTKLEEDIKIHDYKIKHFGKDKKIEEEKKQMEQALKKWSDNEKEIRNACDKTGVHEDNIGRFLKLTLSLIGETVESQAQANILDAELHTFATMLKRECQAKLEIETLFDDRSLNRFTPILAKEDFKECGDLICEDEDEFKEDILHPIQAEIKKEIEAWKKRHPDQAGDPWDMFLEEYRLKKFKQGLANAGLEGFTDIADVEEDDIDDIIKEAGITGLFKKKFKRAINDYKKGNYKKAAKDSKDKPDLTVSTTEDDEKAPIKDKEPKEVTRREMKRLRNICLRPDGKDGWKALEQQKTDLTRLALLQMTPVLGRFFSKIHAAIQQSQKLLKYGDKLNEAQTQAMNALMDNMKPRAIEAPKADGDNDEEEKESEEDTISRLSDYKERKTWSTGGEVQIYSESKQRWYDGTIIKVDDNNDREIEVKYDLGSHQRTKQVDRFGKDVRDPVAVECTAIAAAIVVDINIVDIMNEEWEVSKVTARAKLLAYAIEQSARAILKCQSQIRQSMRLAASILKLKPANQTTAKAMWDAVDEGIIHIISTALEMSKVSAQYFGFFLRFNQSFQKFISMNDQDENVALMISLEDLKGDIREFTKFKKDFNEKVKNLSSSALTVIGNCVKTQIGIESYKKAKLEIERSEKIYQDKLRIYNEKSKELDDELELMKIKRADDVSKAAKFAAELDTLKDSIKQNTKYIADYDKRKGDLLKLNFDANFGDEPNQEPPKQEQPKEKQENDNQDDVKDDK